MNTSHQRLSSYWLPMALLLMPIPGFAAFPQIKLETVLAGQINSPVEMVSSGDGSGRLFIADQRGRIHIFKNGMLQPGVFLDLGPKLVTERQGFDERGLLGLVFHPGYAQPESPGFRRFYVFYSAPSPNAPGTATAPVDCRSVISEFRVSASNADIADEASERILLSFDKPQFNHNGGGIAFGPDGLLYISTGDGGSSNDNNFGHTGGGNNPRPTNAKGNAQDLTNLMGKMLRLDPLGTNGPGGQYGIPPTNPFAGGQGGERPEIYAYGLRNAWRFSFDSRPGGTGLLFAADVGQGAVEEVNIITLGGNYGWRNKEGGFVPAFSIDAPPMAAPDTEPIAQYAHPGIDIGTPPLPQFGISVTGGFIYRGSAIPGLVGKYIFADWSQSFGEPSGRLLGLEEPTPGTWTLSELDVLGGNPVPYFIQGLGQDDSGELYLLVKSATGVSAPDPSTGLPAGAVLKLVPVPATTPLTLTATRDTSIYEEGDFSNGAGEWVLAGSAEPTKNQGAIRRALIGFDISAVPVGAAVAKASLTLDLDQSATADATAFSVHRMRNQWGEGTADAAGDENDGAAASPDDATWLKPFFGQPAGWDLPGGNFEPAPSATTLVIEPTSVPDGIYRWESTLLARDLNAWLDDRDSNFGWVLKADRETVRTTAVGDAGQPTIIVDDVGGLAPGMRVSGAGVGSAAVIASNGVNEETRVVTLSEANSGSVSGLVVFGASSTKRFHSRAAPDPSSRPRLVLEIVPPPPAPSHRRAWEIAGFLPGQFIDDSRDTDGDGIIDGVEYAWGFAPRIANRFADGLEIDTTTLSPGSPAMIHFRRDPNATDLTYRLQVSMDLIVWTNLAVSTAGAAPIGEAVRADTEIDDQSPFRRVSVQDVSPPGAQRFIRLVIERQS